MISLIRLLGFRHYKIRRLRSFLTFSGIAIGVALFLSVHLLSGSTRKTFRESVESLVGEAKLTVLGNESGFSEEILEKLEAFKEIKYVVPVIEAKAFFDNPKGHTENLVVLGLDLLKEGSVRSYETQNGEDLLEDPLVFLNQPDSIVITETFAKEHSFSLNDTFTLRTAEGPKKFVVRGILKPTGVAKAFGGSLAIMDIDGARYTFGKVGKVDRLDLVPKPEVEIKNLQAKLQQAVGPGLKVQMPEGQTQAVLKMVEAFNGLLKFMGVLALLTSVFLVYNTISISIKERESEIATLRTLGMNQNKVFSFFVCEAIAFSLIASLFGILLGFALAQKMLVYINASLSAQLLTGVQVKSLKPDLFIFLLALIVGVFSTVLAVFRPAWKASRIDPIAVLRKFTDQADSEKLFLRLFKAGPICLGLLVASSFANWPAWFFIVESLLFFFGLIFTTGLLVRWSLYRMRKLSFRQGWGFSVLGIDGLLRSAKTTWVSVLSLSVSLAMAGTFAVLNQSFSRNIYSWFDHIFQADFVLAQGSQIMSNQIQPFHEKLLTEISSVPGVRKENGLGAYGMRFVDADYQGQTIKIKAYDVPPHFSKYASFDLVNGDVQKTGPLFFQGAYALVSENMAQNFNLKTGQTLELPTPKGLVPVEVLGVVRDYASPVGTLYLPRTLYRDAWQDEFLTVALVHQDAGVDSVNLEKSLRTGLGSLGLVPTETAELKTQGQKNVQAAFAPAFVIEWIAILIAFFGLVNSVYLRMHQRIPEFGILRAVGVSKGRLALLIVFESVLQTGLTVLTVLTLTGIFGKIWLVQGISSFLGWYLVPYIPVLGLGFLWVFSLCFAVLAACMPALQVRALSVKETLTHD